MGGSNAKEATTPPPQKTTEILPEDEYLRESFLRFKEENRGEEDCASVPGSNPSLPSSTALQRIEDSENFRQVDEERLVRAESAARDATSTLEDRGDTLRYRVWGHYGASLGCFIAMITVVHKKKMAEIAAEYGYKRLHAANMGGCLVAYMAFYHYSRYLELKRVEEQMDRRSRTRRFSSHVEQRAAFLYRQHFAIPERKL